MAWLWSTRTFVGTIIIDTETGWWFQPLWKIWKSVGITIPNIWKVTKFMFQTTNQEKIWKTYQIKFPETPDDGPPISRKNSPWAREAYIDFDRARVQSLELSKKRLQKVLDWLQSVFLKKKNIDFLWISYEFFVDSKLIMDHHGLPNGKEKNPAANAGDMVGHVSGHHPWLQTQVVCHNPADQMDSSFARLFYLTIFLFWLVVYLPLWKMMVFVNGKDDIP